MADLTCRDPAVMENTLRGFLKKNERVLICLPEEQGDALGQMVRRCGAIPVFWGQDHRWKTLLKIAFSQRCGTVIGNANVVLGLSKLAKRVGTPLHIRSAVLTGFTPDGWMVETIQKGLDCVIQACWTREAPKDEDPAVDALRLELRRWTTILDFRLTRGIGGLSLEMTVFPGEKLPKLPTLGKLVIREWEPDLDEPFALEYLGK